MIDAFRARLDAGEVILLDGGIGSELTDRGVPMDEHAWAGPAVLTHADALRRLHEDYIRAGADVITTNTFATSHQGLTAAGLGDRVAEINRRTVEAAREAREAVADRPVLIAGALFPGFKGASRRTLLPEPTPSAATLKEWLRIQVDAMAEGGADVIALEMIPTAFWGRAAAEVAGEAGLPVWLGLTRVLAGMDGRQADVGPLVDALLEPAPAADVMALTVMHTEIEDVDVTLDEVMARWSGPLGVYPHHGRWWTDREVSWFETLPIEPDELARRSRGWVDRGVQIVGGCCGITPAHIRVLRDELPSHIPSGSARRRAAGR